MSSYYISCGCGVLRFPAVYSYQQKEGKFVSELLPRSTAEGTAGGGGGDQKTKISDGCGGHGGCCCFYSGSIEEEWERQWEKSLLCSYIRGVKIQENTMNDMSSLSSFNSMFNVQLRIASVSVLNDADLFVISEAGLL